MRVVSVLPSATEIVCALGARPLLVGRSEECDFPPEVRSLPVVMRARAWDGDRPSSEIEQRVQQTRGAGESLYVLDVERLRSLQPDLLLTQDLCGVCSVTDVEVVAACRVAGVEPQVLSLSPRRLKEVWSSVATVAQAIGQEEAGRQLIARLDPGPQNERPDPPSRSPRVAVVEWLDPPILAGLWAPDMITAARGRSVGRAPGEPGQRTSWADLAALRPDLLVVSPCSFSVERTTAELEGSPLGEAIRAVDPPLGTWVADESFFSRPGPRLADGVRLLSALIRGRPPARPMPAIRWEPLAEVGS